MNELPIGAFFEALFKYGKDYGFTLWHFLGFAILGIILWVGSRVAAGAGRAVQGAQNVYVKMIEDLQLKAEADRRDQEARVESLRQQLVLARSDVSELNGALDALHKKLIEERTNSARLARRLAEFEPHDGGSDEPNDPAHDR